MQEKEQRQRSLLAKHQGPYLPVSTIEHHYLPYELKLAKLSREELSKYSPYNFLFKPLPGSPGVKLDLPGLKQACEILVDNKNGESEYDNVIKTVNKKIESITGKKLSHWQKGQYSEDALKVTYLLFKLQKTLPMGLDIFSKEGNEKYSEIELFTSHHKPTNKNDDFDHIQLLSAWIKELFCNVLFHRSEKERGVLKNLDLIHSGYMRLLDKEIREGRGYNLLINDIFNREKINEELSTTLLRKHKTFTKNNNIKVLENCDILKEIEKNNQKINFSELRKSDLKLAKDSSIIFSKAILKDIYRAERLEDYSILSNIQLKNFSNIIYNLLKKTLSIKDLKLESKKVGSTGSNRTSIRTTLQQLVDQNKEIINMSFRFEDPINMDEYCNLHYKALEEAAKREIENKSHYIADNKDNYVELDNKVSDYLDRMTPVEIFNDIERIRNITMNDEGFHFSILASASGLPSPSNLREIKEYVHSRLTSHSTTLSDEFNYHNLALEKLLQLKLSCAPKPAVVMGYITSLPYADGEKEAAWIIFDSDNPTKSDFLHLWPPSENTNQFTNRDRAQRSARNYAVKNIITPRHDHRCAVD